MRRSGFVTGMAVLAAISLSACGSGAKADDTTAATASESVTSEELVSLKVGNTGNGIKPAMVVLAHEMGYYEEEGLDVTFENIASLNDGLTAIELNKLDILPMGIIPTITFNAQGSDFVIYGGTIAEGSQVVVTEANRDSIKELRDFTGMKIACVRPETGHMIAEGLMRDAGVDVENSVEFIEMDGFQSVVEAVQKGTADAGFVNSGFGQVAEQQGLVVAMNVGDEAPDAVCCRQTTSRKVLEEKRDALVKFQIANLRAYQLTMEDKETAIGKLMEFSGQPREYVDYCLYAEVMKISMDPAKNRIDDFYKVMEANGDIPEGSKWDLDKAVDTSIYEEALKEMQNRYPDGRIWEQLQTEFDKNNR